VVAGRHIVTVGARQGHGSRGASLCEGGSPRRRRADDRIRRRLVVIGQMLELTLGFAGRAGGPTTGTDSDARERIRASGPEWPSTPATCSESFQWIAEDWPGRRFRKLVERVSGSVEPSPGIPRGPGT